MRLILQIVLLPLFLVYMFTFSLFIMPLLYGKWKLGIIGYVPVWLLYALLAIPFAWWDNPIQNAVNNLNRLANAFMGHDGWRTVSTTLGKRIDEGKASWVTCLHCRILAVYDRRKWHCSEKATRLF